MKQMIIGYLDNSKNNISTGEQQALPNRFSHQLHISYRTVFNYLKQEEETNA
jgi:hypothetical protein